jgi:hypothetical protein
MFTIVAMYQSLGASRLSRNLGRMHNSTHACHERDLLIVGNGCDSIAFTAVHVKFLRRTSLYPL